MSIKITPADAAAKHAQNLKNAISYIRAGVNAVTENPMEKAAANKQKWVDGVRDSADKWADRVGSVTLTEWKTAMLEKGLGRIGQGVDASIGKTTDFFSRLFPYEEQLQNEIQSMSDTGIEDSVARSAAWIRGMAKFRG